MRAIGGEQPKTRVHVIFACIGIRANVFLLDKHTQKSSFVRSEVLQCACNPTTIEVLSRRTRRCPLAPTLIRPHSHRCCGGRGTRWMPEHHLWPRTTDWPQRTTPSMGPCQNGVSPPADYFPAESEAVMNCRTSGRVQRTSSVLRTCQVHYLSREAFPAFSRLH